MNDKEYGDEQFIQAMVLLDADDAEAENNEVTDRADKLLFPSRPSIQNF